jgi:hypothetical protein
MVHGSKEKEVSDSPKERGVLIASGFIAGGAMMGVVGAFLNLNEIGKPVHYISIGAKYMSQHVTETGRTIWEVASYAPYFSGIAGQAISLAGLAGLCAFCYFYAIGKRKT